MSPAVLTSAGAARRKRFVIVFVETCMLPRLLVFWFVLHGTISTNILLFSLAATVLIVQLILFTVLHFMFKYVLVSSDKP